MPNPDHMLAYMRAAIRVHNPRDINDWTIDELRAVYHLLPRPEVSFQEWSERMGYSEPDHTDDPPDETREANEHFIEFVKNLNHPDVSITAENTDDESPEE
jgi:hypothetical protein